jgi:hypothetical protein
MPKGKVQQTQRFPKISVQTRITTTTIREPFESSIQNCISHIPIAPQLLPMKERKEIRTISNGSQAIAWNQIEELLTIQRNGQQQTVRAFKKVMPLITPYLWMRFGERAQEPFYWNFQRADINAPENQAYIDILASSLVSQLRGHGIPHFCEFYDAYRGFADVYLYNLEDDIDDFRFSRWFWLAVESGSFGLRMIEKESGRHLTLEEIQNLIKPDEEYLTDSDSDTETVSSEEDDTSIDSNDIEDITKADNPYMNGDLEEIESIVTEADSIEIERRPATHTSRTSTQSDSSTFSLSDQYTLHAELRNMPVAVLFSEKMDGTMDELLEDLKQVPIISAIEQQWTAWIFQICVALANIQTIFQLTHNDLHTNNILWKHTDQEYFYYKAEGRMWKVPTFGKLFTIIDYGRAIFTVNGYTCISSDYHDRHDAAGQYNFGSMEDKDMPRVLPNKSFDLCRLACSLLRGLYPLNPSAHPKGKLLTQDESTKIHETEHLLFNTLWIWLRDRFGKSVLEDASGNERYPGFDLYIYIAANVKGAVPREQFDGPLFHSFIYTGAVPNGINPIPVYL